jgi:hypothetical protein
MKRPIAMIAGFLIVPTCGVVAILTAQERYNSSSNKQRRTSGDAQVVGGSPPVPGYTVPGYTVPGYSVPGSAAPAYPAPQALNRTGDQPYYHAVVDYGSPAQFNPLPQQAQQAMVAQAQQALATASSPEERERVHAKLREALNQQFDADMQQREKELDGIRQRLGEMTRLLEKRSAAKEQIVELRLQVLAQDADGLGWVSAVGRWPSNTSPGVPLPSLPPSNYGFSPYSNQGTGFPAPAAPAPPNMFIPNVINGANIESTYPSALPGRASAPRLNAPPSDPNNFQNNGARSEQPMFSADEEPERFENNRSPDSDDAE